MLKFWKKTGRKEGSINSGSSSSSPSSTPRNLPSPTSNGGGFFLGSLSTQIKELEALIKGDAQEIKSSRLSKTLVEIINDNEALTYFIQYLETVGCGAMIKLILDIQSFNSAFCASNCDSSNSLGENNHYADVEEDGQLAVSKVEKRKMSDSERNKYSNSSFNYDNGSDNGCDDIRCVSDDALQELDGAQNEMDDLREKEIMQRLLNSDSTSESCVDAFKIFKKYFSHKAPLKINIEPDIYKRLIENLKTSINKNTFVEVKEYILKIIEREHFNDYLRSEYHCKYQIDVLTSNKVNISDILYNETTLFYFMEFLEQEGCTNLLEFWISALNFQQQYEEQSQQVDPMQSQGDAMVLYDKYFSLQATSPLHLGDEIRIKVEESICREEGPLPNCFEYPRRLILKFLEINYFPSFLQSQLYLKYLSELISTIQTSPVPGYRSRMSGDSDCNSEISISATNTLLASEDVNPSKKLYRQLHGSSMSIDTQQLYDPDSLWRRGPKRNGLNFGRINALGRFETDLEPEPDKKEESRIAKAVKKLVNLNEDKSKEEMAWQVAAMIVKDVTNITMPSSTES